MIAGVLLTGLPRVVGAESAPVPERTLSEVWALSAAQEPGYRRMEEAQAAAAAEESAVRRARLPEWSVTLAGDYGQRGRPGEERREGVSPRADVVAAGSWTMADSGRAWAEETQRLRQEEARLAVLDQDAAHRARVARVYVEAAFSGARAALRQEHRAAVEALAEIVRRRHAAGVEPGAAARELTDEEARVRLAWADAEQAHAAALRELHSLAGAPVRPTALAPAPPADAPAPGAVESTEVQRLRRQADTERARARALAQEERWRLRLFGAGGTYYSHAFEDGRVQEEYYLGVGGVWRPDFGGVRRQRAVAGERRAGATLAAAESLHLEQARARALTMERWRLHARRREDGAVALAEAAAREEALRLRWREGLEPWRAVLTALARRMELEDALLALQWELAASLVDYAAGADAMDALPHWLGQGRNP
jgi:outer membrane protein TolC